MSAQIQPSITTRLVVAKTLGTFFGLMALVGLSIMLPESGWLTRFGMLAWYITLGSIVRLWLTVGIDSQSQRSHGFAVLVCSGGCIYRCNNRLGEHPLRW